MIFAISKPRTKKVWHEICSACHFGRCRAIYAILAVSLTIAHLANPIGSDETSPHKGGVVVYPTLVGVSPSMD